MSYEFFKFSLLHKNGVNYEIHVNLPIFKKSKNGQKPHKFKNHLTSCFTKVQKLDLGWSDLKFTISVSPYAHSELVGGFTEIPNLKSDHPKSSLWTLVKQLVK